VRVRVRACVCVCACVREREGENVCVGDCIKSVIRMSFMIDLSHSPNGHGEHVCAYIMMDTKCVSLLCTCMYTHVQLCHDDEHIHTYVHTLKH
jgi:hypothetical protein